MSQHDYNIANGGGAAVRADINNALLAVLSQNSGATAPTTTKPFMLWYDTANALIKMRNAADNAWIDYMNSSGQLVAPTATGLITALGGQIKFPASQNASADANTLDDYEEGTWTPTDASGAGLTLTNESTATYTKVGRLVTARFSVIVPSNASGLGTSIGGLPFASLNVSYPWGISIGQTEYSTPHVGGVFGTVVSMLTFGNSVVTNANYSTRRIRASVTYETA